MQILRYSLTFRVFLRFYVGIFLQEKNISSLGSLLPSNAKVFTLSAFLVNIKIQNLRFHKNKKAGLPNLQATRLSFDKTRGFPSLPHSRFGFFCYPCS